MPSVCLMGIGLTTGRETEAGWGGGRGLGPSAPVSRVSGGFHFIVPPHPGGVGGQKTRLGLPLGARWGEIKPRSPLSLSHSGYSGLPLTPLVEGP